ncbi:hypothetical protein ALC57_17300, partial [Trachymyrmex cornetzi]
KSLTALKTSFLKRDDTFRTTYDGLYRELTEVSSAKPLTPRKSEAHRKERPRTPNRVQRGLTLTRSIVCTFSRNEADECHTHDCFPSRCMNRWLNRSDCASETGTSLVGRVRTRRTSNVWFTYKRRANAPADDGHATPPHSPSSVSTYYGDTTFCDAVQLSPEPPPLPRCQPHHRRPAGTDVRTRSAGAQVCVFFYHPPSPSPIRLSIRSFIRKNTHLDRPDRASVNAAPNRGDPEVPDKPKGLRYPACAVTRDTSR